MRPCVLAVCLAAAGFILAGQQEERVRLRAGEPCGPGTSPSSEESIPAPTLGGLQFWADELFFHQWRIQRNAITGHCRLLDENNLRHAWGTYQQCHDKLEQIKRQRQLPPMQGEVVIVLHGLAGIRPVMSPLCKYLQRGGYVVFNVTYPSTRRGIAGHARALAKIIENLDGIEKINFVGHSLGNIVIRRYLAEQTDQPAGRQPDRRIRRFVMIAPPNQGSLLADALAENPLFSKLAGKPGQQLGKQWIRLEGELATPQCEFGILAGGLGNQHGFNPLIPGDDDGTLAVESTRLAGASDFLIVPATHSLLVVDSKVFEYTLRFLQKGYFISADQRQPVPAK